METTQTPSNETETVKPLLRFTPGYGPESEQLVLQSIQEATGDVERYFLYLQYGELLMNMGRWEDSRNILILSAKIALDLDESDWLVCSHEKLGDLSAREGDWLGALHHYRYALRNASSLFGSSATELLEARARNARRTIHATILPQDPDIIPLDREYVHGNLAISFVHCDIFLKRYFARCLECNFCHDWCCSFGADIDIRNVERIQQHKEDILPFIRPSEVEWFEAEYNYYEEYAGNQYTRIQPQGPRCVFISKDQRGCGLHRYAISKQMDYHEIKPLVCILFPLSFEQGILGLAPELDDASLVCSGAGASAYRSLRSEVEHYFGHECVQELDSMERNVLRDS